MKVGVVAPGFSSDSSDWCIPVLVDVIRELSRRADVHVFTLRYPDRRDRYQVHGAEVHALGGGTVRGLRRSGLLAAACASVVAEHRRSPFTVLHGLWADEPGLIAVMAARLLRIPAIVSVMGGELVAMPDIGYGGRLAASNRIFSAIALRGAACVTAASTQPAELVHQAVPPSRRPHIARLVWGIDPSLFEPHGRAFELAGNVRVLHVGSLVPIKDQATLLRAIAVVKESEPGIHLHVVGEGPLRADLEEQAKTLDLARSVTFHGHVDRACLAPYYRAAHVVAVSSRYEAQLVVALEAALCSVPIVGPAVGLVADFAPAAAIAVPAGDAGYLADAICEALQPDRARALRESAARRVGSGYLAPHTADRLMWMYRNPEMVGPAA